MNNKGQTTVLFSLIISVLFLFTLTALEAGRINVGKVKIRAVVHSTQSSIMADYNSELFERYHLLFMDPTYGTGSEAAVEEKAADYLDVSLNGEKGIYQFTVEEVALADQKNILADDMQQLKEQITRYEKTAGIIHRAESLWKQIKGKESDVTGAAEETDRNGVEFAGNNEKNQDGKNQEKGNLKTMNEEDNEKISVEDPRDILNESLKFGLLAFLLPEGSAVSKEVHDFSDSPSKHYMEEKEEKWDSGFQNIQLFKNFLKHSAKENSYSELQKRAALIDYGICKFSNGVNSKEKSVMKCEVEYIIKGKNNDYDNLEGVVNEMMWLRLPINYAYLLTDEGKKSEALTLAAAICTATGTVELIEVVKYLLLGCWAYGETLHEMKLLLSGEKIPYSKGVDTWYTDLKSLGMKGSVKSIETGLDYEDFLMLLLAKKGKETISYARLLDLIEINLQKTDSDFEVENCAGGLTVQGRITENPLFRNRKENNGYEYYFEKSFSYE